VKRKLFLDLDGVLADFESRAKAILACEDIRRYEFVYGAEDMWSKLNAVGDFFRSMEFMDGAVRLWSKVKHLNPTILTAIPKTNPESAERQKRDWVRFKLGRDAEVITCLTKDKPNYCAPGAILVDDRAVNRKEWEAKGGILVLHENALTTIDTLRAIGVL
jgi:hypothetical protein